MTHCLIYSSEAADNVSDADLRMIAMFSRMNNRRKNIAGLLLHHEGYIMQVLEGEKDVVQELFSRIKADARHENVKLLMDNTTTSPIFEEWSMGFRPMISVKEMDAFFELSKETLERAVPADADEDVRHAVCEFAQISGLK